MEKIIFWAILFAINFSITIDAMADDDYCLFTLAVIACLMAAFMLIVRIVYYINNK